MNDPNSFTFLSIWNLILKLILNKWRCFMTCPRRTVFTTIIFIIGFFGSILCFIPSFCNWKMVYSDNREHDSLIVIHSMKSNIFQMSLIASIFLSIPMLIDFSFDVLSLSSQSWSNGNFSRFILLFTQFIPNLLIVAFAAPEGNVELVASLFQARDILIVCTTFAHLCEFGYQIFNSQAMLSMSIIFTICELLLLLSTFMSNVIIELFYVCFVLILLVILWFMYFVFKWLVALRKTEFKQFTNDQYSCNVYIISLLLCIIFITIISLVNGCTVNGQSSVFYLVSRTSCESAFTLAISILQGRIARKEVLRAQQSLEMKRTFVRLVSHEIRTPLNTVCMGIKLLKDLMKRKSYDEEASEIVEDIEESCIISLNILNDLLSYEKLDAGIMTLDVTQFRAMNFVRETIRPFYIQARQAGVVLHLSNDQHRDVAVESALLLADKYKLSQVLRNLLSNALKFTPKGGFVTVTAGIVSSPGNGPGPVSEHQHGIVGDSVFAISSTESNSQRKKYIRIEVIDTGHGISKENLSRIFNEIVQFTPGLLQNGGGSGLGLWISKSIMDLHNGYISVLSDGEGHGCTFTLEIPLDAKHLSDRSTVSVIQPTNATITPSVIPSLPHILSKGNTTTTMTPTMEEVMKKIDDGSNNNNTTIVSYIDPLSGGSTGTRTSSSNNNNNNNNEVKQPHETDRTTKQHLTRHRSTFDNCCQDLEQQGDVENMDFLPYDTTRRNYLPSPSNHTRVSPYEPELRVSKISNATTRISHHHQHQHPMKTYNQHHYHHRDLSNYEAIATTTTTAAPPYRKQRSEEDLSGRGSIPSASSVSGRSDTGTGKKVLVVDDSPMNRKMLVKLLQPYYPIIQTAEDGAEAVSAVDQALEIEEPYDIIIMDHEMPNMNGSMAARVIRNMGFMGPIIGVTGNALPKDKEIFIASGANHVLPKPVNILHLQKAISDAERNY